MTESSEPNQYYLIAVGDKEGHSARGPFSSYEEALDQRGPNESAISHTRLERLRNPQPFVAAEDKAVKPPYDWGKLGSRIRSWAWSLVVIGVLSLLMNNLSGTWGVMLILLGLASFYFEVPSMLFVYGITIFWAGLNNAATGGGGLVAAAIQFMIAFGLLRDYVRSIKHERERLATSEAEPERRPGHMHQASHLFPWLGAALGVMSLAGFAAYVVLVLFSIALEVQGGLPPLVYWLVDLLVNFGVVGFALGVSSLLSGYRFKGAAVAGLVTGGLTMLLILGVIALSLFGNNVDPQVVLPLPAVLPG